MKVAAVHTSWGAVHFFQDGLLGLHWQVCGSLLNFKKTAKLLFQSGHTSHITISSM